MRFILAFKDGGGGLELPICDPSTSPTLSQSRGQLTFVECKEAAETLRWIGREFKGHLSTLGQSNKAGCNPSQVNYHEDPLNIKEEVPGFDEGWGKRGWLSGRKLGFTSNDFLFLSLSFSICSWGAFIPPLPVSRVMVWMHKW